jgi:hypothetical protein
MTALIEVLLGAFACDSTQKNGIIVRILKSLD